MNNFNGSSLAYIGDAVIELLAREKVIETGKTDLGELNELTRAYVTAKNQSEAVERILDLLTEDEKAIFLSGRNSHKNAAPKSATMIEYRRATGMEALFGYLYIKCRKERIRYLFDRAYDIGEEK